MFEDGLSLYLTDVIGMNYDYISYIYALRAFSYALFSKVMPYIIKYIPRRWILCFGLFIVVLANLFTGGSSYIGLDPGFGSVIVGMLLNGVASGCIYVCMMPELLYVASMKIGTANDEKMNEMMSGVYFSVYNTGYLFAPILCGLLTDAIDYGFACNMGAILSLIIFMFFFVIFLLRKTRLSSPEKKRERSKYHPKRWGSSIPKETEEMDRWKDTDEQL